MGRSTGVREWRARDLAVTSSSANELEVALDPPRRGDFQLRLRATQTIGPDQKELRLPLPTLRNAATLPAMVVVSPADQVVLSSSTEDNAAFESAPVPEELALERREQQPMGYRYRGQSERSQLLYAFEIRPRRIAVESQQRVSLGDENVSVEQVLSVDVRYQPLEFVELIVPAALPRDRLEVLVDDELVAPERILREEAGRFPETGGDDAPGKRWEVGFGRNDGGSQSRVRGRDESR